MTDDIRREDQVQQLNSAGFSVLAVRTPGGASAGPADLLPVPTPSPLGRACR